MKIKVKVAKPKTRLEKFYEIFPNAERKGNGCPYPCVEALGWCTGEECDNTLIENAKTCKDCWNMPYKE